MKPQFNDNWIKSIGREFESHAENNMWSIKDRDSSVKLIPTKWVFTVKGDKRGRERAKVRLLAVGCDDPTEYSLTEKHSPVGPIEIIRFVLSLAVDREFSIITIDVTTALL